MTEQVNISDARTHLSKLKQPPRAPGAWASKVWMSDDFDEPDEELIDLFCNGPIFPEATDV